MTRKQLSNMHKPKFNRSWNSQAGLKSASGDESEFSLSSTNRNSSSNRELRRQLYAQKDSRSERKKLWFAKVLCLLALMLTGFGLFIAGYKVGQFYTRNPVNDELKNTISTPFSDTLSPSQSTSTLSPTPKKSSVFTQTFKKLTTLKKTTLKQPSTSGEKKSPKPVTLTSTMATRALTYSNTQTLTHPLKTESVAPSLSTKKLSTYKIVFDKPKSSTKKSPKTQSTKTSIYMEPSDPMNNCPLPRLPSSETEKFIKGGKTFFDGREASTKIRTQFIDPVMTKAQLLHECTECHVYNNFLTNIFFDCIFAKKPQQECIRVCKARLQTDEVKKECLNNKKFAEEYSNITNGFVFDAINLVKVVCMQRPSSFLFHIQSMHSHVNKTEEEIHAYFRREVESNPLNIAVCKYVPQAPLIHLSEITPHNGNQTRCRGLD